MVLYISDYTLTLTCARLYHAGVHNKLVFEGSYELNPFFQKDIDSLKRISPRFVISLLATAALLFAVWWLVPEMYPFLLGALILTQLAIHVRHFRNLYVFRAATTDDIRGRIEYSRQNSYRLSSVEMICFCGLYLCLFLFTESWFILGGALSCLSVAAKHRRLARKQLPQAATDSGKAVATSS